MYLRRLVCGAVVCFGLTGSAFAYNLGGTSTLVGGSDPDNSWAFNGSDLTAYNGAITNTANFGPSGTVKTSVNTSFLGTVNSSTLSGLNGFIAPYWTNSNASPAAVTAVTNFFLSGGGLFLLDDDDNHDAVAAALGIPTDPTESNGSVSNGTGPLITGPFGTATNVAQQFTVGFLDAADVTAHHGHIGSINSAGQITSAYWLPGDYAPGAGAMVITGDVDMISNAGTAVSYDPLNGNGIFALNATAFLIANAGTITPAVPLPAAAPVAMVMLGGLGIVAAIRRRVRA